MHFKTCEGSYAETFDKMLEVGTVSTCGLQPDAKVIDELVFDMNTTYLQGIGIQYVSTYSSTPIPSKILSIHFSILDSRVLDCLAAEK